MIYRVTVLIVAWWKEGLPGQEPEENIRCLWYLYRCQDDNNDLLATTHATRTSQARHPVAGSIVCPGHVPFVTFPSVSLLFQINTVLCLVSQLMQPALKQRLTLGYSEQIITFPCAVRQMPYFTQRQSWLVFFFFLKVKTYRPGSHLHKQKILLLWKAEEMKAGNEGRQKNKGRKLVYWRGGVWMVWSLPFLTFKNKYGENCPKQWKYLIQDMDASCKHTTLTWQILPIIQNVHPSRRNYFFPLATGSALKVRTDVIREKKLYTKHQKNAI